MINIFKMVDIPAGSVAHFCNPASGRLVVVDVLSLGVLLDCCLRWTGVRTKPSINMDMGEESSMSRLTKEERIGSGGKPSSQKHSCWAVVGSRPWVGTFQQPSRYGRTYNLFSFIFLFHSLSLSLSTLINSYLISLNFSDKIIEFGRTGC